MNSIREQPLIYYWILFRCSCLRANTRRAFGRSQTWDNNPKMWGGCLATSRIVSLDVQCIRRANGTSSSSAFQWGTCSLFMFFFKFYIIILVILLQVQFAFIFADRFVAFKLHAKQRPRIRNGVLLGPECYWPTKITMYFPNCRRG